MDPHPPLLPGSRFLRRQTCGDVSSSARLGFVCRKLQTGTETFSERLQENEPKLCSLFLKVLPVPVRACTASCFTSAEHAWTNENTSSGEDAVQDVYLLHVSRRLAEIRREERDDNWPHMITKMAVSVMSPALSHEAAGGSDQGRRATQRREDPCWQGQENTPKQWETRAEEVDWWEGHCTSLLRETGGGRGSQKDCIDKFRRSKKGKSGVSPSLQTCCCRLLPPTPPPGSCQDVCPLIHSWLLTADVRLHLQLVRRGSLQRDAAPVLVLLYSLPPTHYHSVSPSLSVEACTLPAAWQPLVSLSRSQQHHQDGGSSLVLYFCPW